MATIEKMTIQQLEQLIDRHIEERLTRLMGHFEIEEDDLLGSEEPDNRSWQEVKQDIERDRWTPPPGAKSSLDLLREDRES